VLVHSCTDTNTSTTEKMILERVEELNDAFKEGDVEKLKSMVTEDYWHTNGSSAPIGKSDWLAYLKNRSEEIKNGDLTVNSYDMEEARVKIYGTTAMVTAKIIVSTSKSGERRENEFRTTHLWIKENGNWKRAGFHDGKIN
ncbi:MAG: nuclear transport factor 2 family protein, partial [Saonia sp.]